MNSSHVLPGWAAAALLPWLLAVTTVQAAVLVQHPPTLAADAVRNGSEGQAGLLAETLTFSGTGQLLAWWGTQSTGFVVQVYGASDPAAPLLSTTTVTSTATPDTVSIDGNAHGVYRFSIDLPGLAGGNYIVSVLETALDPQGGTWYWLLGTGGDGEHVSGFGEFFEAVDRGGDLALEVLGDPSPAGVPAPATWLLALAAWPAWLVAGQRRRSPAGPAAA